MKIITLIQERIKTIVVNKVQTIIEEITTTEVSNYVESDVFKTSIETLVETALNYETEISSEDVVNNNLPSEDVITNAKPEATMIAVPLPKTKLSVTRGGYRRALIEIMQFSADKARQCANAAYDLSEDTYIDIRKSSKETWNKFVNYVTLQSEMEYSSDVVIEVWLPKLKLKCTSKYVDLVSKFIIPAANESKQSSAHAVIQHLYQNGVSRVSIDIAESDVENWANALEKFKHENE